jgi:hypothetical protein
VPPGHLRVDGGVGRFELTENVVAEGDRVREILEPQRVLGEAGNRKDARHSPERDDEFLVLELDAASLGLDHDVPCQFVEADRLAEH